MTPLRGSYLYRLTTIPGVVKHMSEIISTVAGGFEKHVPNEDGGAYGRLIPKGLSVSAVRKSIAAARDLDRTCRSTYSGVPRREILAMLAGLVRSEGPGHDPMFEKLPQLAARWFKRYDEDPSVAGRWYSVGAP
jgi:hypothetical protein